MENINTLKTATNTDLLATMSKLEIKKAIELYSDVDLFLNKYKQCSLLVDDEDFVSFLEYLEIEENLRMGYLI